MSNPSDDLDAYAGVTYDDGKASPKKLMNISIGGQPKVRKPSEDLDAYANSEQITPSDISPSILSEVGRQLGLTARDVAEGNPYTAIPLAVGDVANKGINYATGGINKLTGSNIPQLGMPSQEFSNALTDVGLPQPQGGLERVINNTAKGVVGAGSSVAAGNMLASSANPVASSIGQTLSGNPLSQLGAGATGAGASSVAQEEGASPVAQSLYGLGGALAIPAGVAGLRAAISKNINPLTLASAKQAENLYGIKIPNSQLTESQPIKWLKSVLPAIPGSGFGGEMDNARSQFTRAVSQTFGEDTPNLTRGVIDSAKKRIGNIYEKVAQNTPTVKVDLNNLDDLASEARKSVENPSRLLSHIDYIKSLADEDGNISGSDWQKIMRSKSTLNRLSKDNNINMRESAKEVSASLRNDLSQASTSETQNLLSTANEQWKNLKTVEDLATKAGVTGEINPLLVMAKAGGTKKTHGEFGINQLQDLGDIGQKFFKDMPSSGTSERQAYLKYLGAAGLGGAATSLMGGNVGAALGTLGTMAATSGAANLAGRAINSQAYRNMLMGAKSDYLKNVAGGVAVNRLANP